MERERDDWQMARRYPSGGGGGDLDVFSVSSVSREDCFLYDISELFRSPLSEKRQKQRQKQDGSHLHLILMLYSYCVLRPLAGPAAAPSFCQELSSGPPLPTFHRHSSLSPSNQYVIHTDLTHTCQEYQEILILPMPSWYIRGALPLLLVLQSAPPPLFTRARPDSASYLPLVTRRTFEWRRGSGWLDCGLDVGIGPPVLGVVARGWRGRGRERGRGGVSGQ